MRITFFCLIVVPSILAFFLGYLAHGLKFMLKTAGEGEPDRNGNQNASLSEGLGAGSESQAEEQKETANV